MLQNCYSVLQGNCGDYGKIISNDVSTGCASIRLPLADKCLLSAWNVAVICAPLMFLSTLLVCALAMDAAKMVARVSLISVRHAWSWASMGEEEGMKSESGEAD